MAPQCERWNMCPAVVWMAPGSATVKELLLLSSTLIADCLSRRIMDIDRLLGGFFGGQSPILSRKPFCCCCRCRRYICSVCVCPGHTLRGGKRNATRQSPFLSFTTHAALTQYYASPPLFIFPTYAQVAGVPSVTSTDSHLEFGIIA